MKRSILFLALIGCSCSTSTDTINLFNGKDLTGWDTYVRGTGLNNDPDSVFSVVTIDGKPAIKVSGLHFGGLSTTEEFSNYHLTVHFKWGEAKYAPKLNDKRDSGLLYHGVGEHGVDAGSWLRSQEFQVQEGDCGDYWGVAGGTFDVPVVMADSSYVYEPTGDMMTFAEKSEAGRHATKSPDAENPTGEWNILEVYCFGDSAVHIVNGVVNMKLFKSRQIDENGERPLKKGKIQFQSEGAEVYYRNIELQKIKKMPELGQ